TIFCARLHPQARREPVDRLVMDRYDAPRTGLAIEPCEPRAGLEAHFVRVLVVGVAAMRGNVLVQRAAERDVDELRAAADAEHRLAGSDERAHQLDLVAVAHRIAGPLGLE